MELRYKHFLARLREEVNSRGHGSKAEIGNNSGCQGAFIGQILKKNATKRASLKLQKAIAEYISGDEDRFFDEGRQILETGCIVAQSNPIQKPLIPPDHKKTDLEIKADETHEQLAGRFVDKKTALKINQLLVRLEELENGDGLKAALEWAEYRVHQAEKKRGLDQGSTGTEGK